MHVIAYLYYLAINWEIMKYSYITQVEPKAIPFTMSLTQGSVKTLLRFNTNTSSYNTAAEQFSHELKQYNVSKLSLPVRLQNLNCLGGFLLLSVYSFLLNPTLGVVLNGSKFLVPSMIMYKNHFSLFPVSNPKIFPSYIHPITILFHVQEFRYQSLAIQ